MGTLFRNGSLPDYLNTFYWQVTGMIASAENHVCYMNPIEGPPEHAFGNTFASLTESLSESFPKEHLPLVTSNLTQCINEGPRSIPWDTCQAVCKPYVSMDQCKLNRYGCCICPFLSYKYDPQSTVMVFEHGSVGWIILPGWVNLGIWCVLLILVVLLVWLSSRNKIRSEASTVNVPAGVVGLDGEKIEDSNGGEEDSHLMIEDALGMIPRKSHVDEKHSVDIVSVPVVPGAVEPARYATLLLIRGLTVLGMVLFALWVLIYLNIMQGLGYQNYFAWTGSAVGVFWHTMTSALWLVCGSMQFVEYIRHRYPAFHRSTGYAAVFFNINSIISLLLLVSSQHETGISGLVVSWTYCAYWFMTMVFGIKYAIERNIYEHRIWITRNFYIGGSIVWLFIFNAMSGPIFKYGASFYMGPFYDLLCDRDVTIITASMSNGTQASLNQNQTIFGCQGADGLFEALDESTQFWWTLLWIGFLGCEIWLYIRFRDGYFADIVNKFHKGSENIYDVIIPASLPKTPVHVLRSAHNMEVVLVGREREGNSVRFRFALPHPQMVLHIPPGHCILINIPDTLVWREYSPINSYECGSVSFMVKKVVGGLVSTHLFENTKNGDKINISGPFGHSRIYAPATYSEVVLVGASTGVAPLLTIIESALADPLDSTKFHFILAGAKVEDLCSQFFLENLASTHSKRMKLSIVLSRPDDVESWMATGNNGKHVNHFTGKLNNAETLDSVIGKSEESNPSSDDTMIFVCGRPLFNLEVSKAARKIGYRHNRVFAIGTDDR